jgi:hypothetical protein
LRVGGESVEFFGAIGAFVIFPAGLKSPGGTCALVAPELGKGFMVQFGGIGFCLLHPGGLSEDIITTGPPVVLPEGGFALVVPGGTLNMLPRGGGPVLVLGGGSSPPA